MMSVQDYSLKRETVLDIHCGGLSLLQNIWLCWRSCDCISTNKWSSHSLLHDNTSHHNLCSAVKPHIRIPFIMTWTISISIHRLIKSNSSPVFRVTTRKAADNSVTSYTTGNIARSSAETNNVFQLQTLTSMNCREWTGPRKSLGWFIPLSLNWHSPQFVGCIKYFSIAKQHVQTVLSCYCMEVSTVS